MRRDRKRVEYIILWTDGSSSTHTDDADWGSLSTDDVQIVVENYDDESRTVHQGSDYYMMLPDGDIVSFDREDLHEYLRRFMPVLKHGRWIQDDQFEAVLDQVRL